MLEKITFAKAADQGGENSAGAADQKGLDPASRSDFPERKKTDDDGEANQRDADGAHGSSSGSGRGRCDCARCGAGWFLAYFIGHIGFFTDARRC